MKQAVWSVGLAIALCLTVSCSYQKRQEVKEGLNTSVTQLPELDEFEVATVLFGDSSMESCYYAEAYMVLGTSLPSAEAIDVYVSELQSLGWNENQRPFQNDRVLTRGTHERIGITNTPRWYVEKNEDYLRAKDTYPTIIFVSLWFYVPQRDGC